MISQFYVLSLRGDTIIFRDYLGNVQKGSSEVFFRRMKFWDKEHSDAPPVFMLDGVSYLHVKEGTVLLVATTRDNVSPSLVLELLKRIAGIIKDYCGLVSEEAVRKNFLLIYELLDEVIDYGYPQNSSSEALREFVLNEPTVLKQRATGLPLIPGVARGPTGVIKSILDTSRTGGGRRDEIFVDIVEKISCTFNSAGSIQTSQIDGSVQVKSYLMGNPDIKMALNENLTIGRQDGAHYGGYGGPGDAVMLDDCNFHESVSLERFETERLLYMHPPDGEFAVMNYRSTYNFNPPFRVNMDVDPDTSSGSAMKALVNIRLKANFADGKAAAGIEIVIPLPKEVQRVSCDPDPAHAKPSGNQTWDWQEKAGKLLWRFKRLPAGAEATLRCRLALDGGFTVGLKKSLGPINLQFTIPMYCASRLQVRFLQIMKSDPKYNPYRWVRYLTLSNSYVIRS